MRTKLVGASVGAVVAASICLAGWSAGIAGASTVGTQPTKPAAVTATGSAGVPKTVGRSWLEQALSRRQATLAHLTASVEGSHTLSTSVRKTLESQLAAETSGIEGLASAAPGEPTATLPKTASTMVHQYRVYLVMVPKVRIAEKAARQQQAEQHASQLETRISARIAAAQKAGRTVAQAQSAYQNLVTEVSQATSDSAGAFAVLSVQPSGYPADEGSISSARGDVRSARSVLPAVRQDLRSIRSSLRPS
jgi:hypothetical protein